MKKNFPFLLVALFLSSQPFLRAQSEKVEVEDGDWQFSASETDDEDFPETNKDKDIEMITQRMKELTGSLQGMPEIPRLNQTLMIPAVDPSMTGNKKVSGTEDKDIELQQKEKTP